RAFLANRRGRFGGEQFQRPLDPPKRKIDERLDLRHGQPIVRAVQRLDDVEHIALRRKGLPYEEVDDLVILGAAQQNPKRLIDGAPGSSDLLVVMNDRSGTLEVNDESEVGLVEAHAK